MSVARSQDAFKRRTLEAMAAGRAVSGDYQEASDSIASAEQEAMRQQGGAGSGGGFNQEIASDIAGEVTQSSDAVQQYLGEMQGAQDTYDAAFQQAQAGYAPPPIYGGGGGGGGGGGTIVLGGLDAEDLAIKPQVFPEEYGGGLRYGGFRTQAEGGAAVAGLANRERAAWEAEQAALAQAAGGARQNAAITNRFMGYGQRWMQQQGEQRGEAETARQATANRYMGQGRAQWEAQQAQAVPRQVAPAGPSTSPRQGGALTQARPAAPEILYRQRNPVDVQAQQQAAQQTPVEQALIDALQQEGRGLVNDAVDQQAEAAQFVVPEQWELQQQAAQQFGYNPYIAEGLWDAPTPGERNSEIRSELELNDRLSDPYGEGRLPTERRTYDEAMLDQTYGTEVVDASRRLGIDPDTYIGFAADPIFQQAEAEANAIFYETGGNIDQINATLIEYGLPPAAINMILDTFGSAGVNPNSASVDPNYVYGG